MRILLFVFLIQQVVSERNDCGNTSFSGSDGVVKSPNFPLPYPHDTNCTYSIDVGLNNSVVLKFLEFDLERAANSICLHDWLQITCRETDDENPDFGKRYCGTDLPRTSLRFFHCPVVLLTFSSDRSITSGGFVIEYTVFEKSNLSSAISDLPCGQISFNSSSGSIRIPKNPTEYSASINCVYTILANDASRISVGVQPIRRLDLLDSFADCSRENIMIGCVADGETELNPNTSNKFCRHSFHFIFFGESHLFFSRCRTLKISIRSSNYNYRGDDSFMFTVSEYDTECGTGSYTGPTGVVVSPRFPLSYPHSLNCMYSIEVDPTKTISLDFVSFHLEGTSHPLALDECSHDWLTISCSVPSNPYPIRKFCGEKTKPNSLSYSNCASVSLNFVSDASITYGGYQIRYTISSGDYTTTPEPAVGCGNTSFTGPTGFIASPRFPLSYPNNVNCVYSIEVDRSKLIALHFISFNIEGTSRDTYLDSCAYDWLMISCTQSNFTSEVSHRNRKYCGEKESILTLEYSECDSLELNFVTDSSVSSGGFQLKYSIMSPNKSDCGDTLFSGPTGIITSPRHPFAYPQNMSCTYSIDVGRNSSVLLRFAHFDLEAPNPDGYCTDFLMISCYETTKANLNRNKKYCGLIHWKSSLRIVDCPSLMLEFYSNFSRSNGAGFLILYTVIENSNSTDDNSVRDCGTTLFTNSSGVISLPRNTRNYLVTVNCTYTISANRPSYISVGPYLSSSIKLIDSFEDCETDSLTVGCVSEGKTELNPNTTMVFCRGRRPPLQFPHSSLVFEDCRTVKFSIRSANYDNRNIIPINFLVVQADEVCGTTSFSAPSGVISSRHFSWQYGKSVNCLYTIDSGHVNSVIFIFDRLSLGYTTNGNATCYNGSVTISCLVNGTSVAHPHADRKLCQTQSSTITRFPSCRVVLVDYSVNSVSYGTGFSLRYRLGDYDPECGNTSYSGPTGFITSPLFPLSYPHNLNCLYSISGGGKRNAISLSFLSFNLEGTSNAPSIDTCNHDWLTVNCFSDESDITNISWSRKYCGVKTMPLKFTFSSCPVVMLNFRSDGSVNRDGYKARYTVIDTDSLCGVPVYGPPFGVISTPWNYTDYGDSFDCNYAINAAEPSSISFTIWSISLQGAAQRNCQNDWLLISCTNGETGLYHRVSHRSCDSLDSSSQLTFPSCTAAKVDYHRDSEASGKAFRIEYTVSRRAERTTEPPMTSVSAKTICPTGCRLSSDATHCKCLPVSSEVPVATTSTYCESSCKKSGTTCVCSKTHPVNAGYAVAISLTVILLLIGAICVGAFLFRRHQQTKNRSERLLEATAEDRAQMEMESNTAISGSQRRDYRNLDEDTSRYVPLRPMSFGDRE